MNRKIHRLIVVMTAAIIVFACGVFVNASTSRTQAEAIAWCNSQSGQMDYDGNGSWCVDFIYYYTEYLGCIISGGNANTYGNKSLNSNYYSYVYSNPQPGDILVSQAGSYGHVAVVLSDNGNYVYSIGIRNDVNGANPNVTKGNISKSSITCYIRPKFANELPTSGAPEINIPSGVYTIHSAWDYNQVVDIAGDSTENHANIQLYQQLNNDVQKFRLIKMDGYYVIKSIYADKWLDASLPIGDWSNVQLWYDNTSDEEKWILEDAGNGYVYFRNMTGYYLDVQGDVARDHANLQLYHFVGNNSQKWQLEDKTQYVDFDDAVYTIHSAWDDNQVLDIAGDSKELRANIQLYHLLNNTVQQFNVVKIGDSYCLRNIYADLWLDIHLPYKDWANVQLWQSNTSIEEKWTFEDAGNGYVFIRSNTGYYLDVQGDVAKDHANIQIYHFVGNNSQRWKFKKIVTESEIVDNHEWQQIGLNDVYICKNCDAIKVDDIVLKKGEIVPTRDLANNHFETKEKIEAALRQSLTGRLKSPNAKYQYNDISLESEMNIPVQGITIIIPYSWIADLPKDIALEDLQHYNFVIAQMKDSGVDAGKTEILTPKVTTAGLEVTVDGFSPFAIGFEMKSDILGDFNNDLHLTADDLAIFSQVMLTNSLSDDLRLIADINKDKKIDYNDAIMLRNIMEE